MDLSLENKNPSKRKKTKMSEKTLKEVGKEASSHYSQHELRAEMLRQAEKSGNQDLIKTEKEGYGGYNQRIDEAAKFAKDNAEQLHDFAVIEAHLGGVAINVKQPLEIGQKVEVKVENK